MAFIRRIALNRDRRIHLQGLKVYLTLSTYIGFHGQTSLDHKRHRADPVAAQEQRDKIKKPAGAVRHAKAKCSTSLPWVFVVTQGVESFEGEGRRVSKSPNHLW